jgi:bifunctional non-homologous end joining protein LigD
MFYAELDRLRLSAFPAPISHPFHVVPMKKKSRQLETYRKKRRFEQTPEPAGEVRPAGKHPRFVVQMHAATRLHYDFRLEADGVLKSWAIPKGPSLNPKDKRLAVHVEDHPLDYIDFEGVIPKGNYGAGEVIVWDQGFFEPVGNSVSEGIERGHVTVILQGEKLQGEFALVRLKSDDDKRNWLLIKADDDFASSSPIKDQASVLSHRTLAMLRKDKAPKRWVSRRKTKVSLPASFSPMLARSHNEAFNDPEWVFEPKWDGYRAVAILQLDRVRLFSRTAKSLNERFPHIVRALGELNLVGILDGEIVAVDEHGVAKFQLLQNSAGANPETILYEVFDAPYLDGENLTDLPLVERKERLRAQVPDSQEIRYCDHVAERGEEFFALAIQKGLEGILAKDRRSRYEPGKRSSSWLKIKARAQQEAVICGYTAGKGSRSRFGSIILGVYQGSRLRYAGHTGTGFSEKVIDDLLKQFKPLIVTECPFTTRPKTNGQTYWLNPDLVCEVVFQEWTVEGIMRQPAFLGLRDDKDPKEAMRES